jgi:hypothetical protein
MVIADVQSNIRSSNVVLLLMVKTCQGFGLGSVPKQFKSEIALQISKPTDPAPNIYP